MFSCTNSMPCNLPVRCGFGTVSSWCVNCLSIVLFFLQTYLLTSFWLILWHLATTSLTHSFCNYYQSFRSQLRSGTPHWTHELAVGVRHATLNSHDRGWGPARHTELAGSELRSGTPQLNSRAPGWGSGTPHWTHELAVEVRHATLNTQDRSWGPTRRRRHGGGRGEWEGEGGEETDIKSNNPHLTGGEKSDSKTAFRTTIASGSFWFKDYRKPQGCNPWLKPWRQSKIHNMRIHPNSSTGPTLQGWRLVKYGNLPRITCFTIDCSFVLLWS